MKGLWYQEWKLFLKAPANLTLIILLSLLTCLGAWNGAQRLQVERTRVHEAIKADAASFASKRAQLVKLESGKLQEGRFGSPRKVHQAVLSAARPIAPPPAELAILSSAKARPTPDLLFISILTRHKDQQPTLDDPSNRLDGPFDIAFVATWLAPLFALLLGFDVLARDREQDVSRMLASQGRSLAVIAGVRLAVRLVAIFVAISAPVLLTILVTEGSKLQLAAPAIGLWLLALLLSLGFWLSLAAIVNATARNAAAASLILLTAWIVASMLVPAVIGGVTNMIAPPPDRLEGVLAMRSLETSLTQRRRDVTEAYYAANPNNAPVAKGDEYEHYFVTEMYPRTLQFDRDFAPIAARLDQARVSQARFMRVAAILSPSLAFKLLTEDLAGAAPERRVAFFAAVDSYQSKWRAHFDHKLASMRPMTTDDYDNKPEFVSVPEDFRQRWRRVGLLLLALAAPFTVVSIWGWSALRRAQAI
jgi:ABC-2 type transport system permease protein